MIAVFMYLIMSKRISALIGVMMDAGLFEPLIAKILKIVKGDPLKVIDRR
ncbi:hypothetical protein BCE02nite_26370 [Brevibacillus centrosporus]|nr:hypothetical protein BCE02nite_26370 [Brevibacillus centrosporus]